MQKETDEAIGLFGDENAGSIVLLKNYEAYYDGYDEDGKHHVGYEELIAKLETEYQQEYQSIYLDLYQEWKKKKEVEKENINDDIVFEMELVRQVEINIDCN